MIDLNQEAAPCRFFFRKTNRILKRSEFLHVYENGKCIRRGLLHVFILPPNAEDDGANAPTRIGITVTKKAGNSVKRNRARRLVRESFRLILPDLLPGYRIVVNAMRSATLTSQSAVQAQLSQILRDAGVFRPTPDATIPNAADNS